MSDKYQSRCRGILRGVQFGWNEYEGQRHPQIVGRFEILDGDDAGRYETWFASLSDDVNSKGRSFYEYTIEALRVCGWTGDDLSALPKLVEEGQVANEVGLTREHKLGTDGKWRTTARYVNRLGAVKVDLGDNAMSDADVADFARRMRSRIAPATGGNGSRVSSQPSNGAPPANRRRSDDRDVPPPDDGEIPF